MHHLTAGVLLSLKALLGQGHHLLAAITVAQGFVGLENVESAVLAM